MQESYKRLVKTWICFANPWIRLVSSSQILTPKRFVSYRDWRIRLHRFASLILKVSNRDLNFQRFNLFSRIQQILTNHYESRLADSQIRTLKIRIADSIRRIFFKRFVSWIRIVRPKTSKDLIQFGRIRVWFPHPYLKPFHLKRKRMKFWSS
jgi:hypothetical protein